MADLTIESMPRQLSDRYTPPARLPRSVPGKDIGFLRPIAQRVRTIGALSITIDFVALCAGNTTANGSFLQFV
jgi:hypothetical protein